jgi:nitroreductase
MLYKPATTRVPIAELLARRWSARALDPEKPVTRQELLALLEAARWAPSCFGDQPWRYLVWDRFRDAHGWSKAVLILSVAAPGFRANGKLNRWGQHDTGAASENLCLQASDLGLVAHQMGGFSGDRAQSQFGIPEDHICMAMIAVGHPGPLEALEGDLRDREAAPRQRLPLGECFFEGDWGIAVVGD